MYSIIYFYTLLIYSVWIDAGNYLNIPKEAKLITLWSARGARFELQLWGPVVLRSGDLAAHYATGFEHLAQENYFASPGGLPSSTSQIV